MCIVKGILHGKKMNMRKWVMMHGYRAQTLVLVEHIKELGVEQSIK
jgi:hypothetical protein